MLLVVLTGKGVGEETIPGQGVGLGVGVGSALGVVVGSAVG